MELEKIQLPFKIDIPVLGLGSQVKNRACFAKGRFAYLSALHQNLNDPRDFLNFQKSVKYFLKKKPRLIAHDLHPEYQSTKYIQNLSAKRYRLYAIQHHHAHIASCMLDNELKNQEVIGVAFDGTGLGIDGKIWGAEFLLCNYRNFKRRAHLKEIPLLGQEQAILEPWRLAAIWLYFAYGDRFMNLDINFIKKIDKKKWKVLKHMYSAGFNSPLASSMGRLFDAVASLVLGKFKVSFEAELAMALEEKVTKSQSHKVSAQASPKGARSVRKPPRRGQSQCATLPEGGKVTRYHFDIVKDKEYIIDPAPMFKDIVRELKAGRKKEEIAYSFHATVASMIRKVCLIIRQESRINKVVLSGGVFQNKVLLGLSLDLLYREGFQVFGHREIPCNDSGISLGQAVIAYCRS